MRWTLTVVGVESVDTHAAIQTAVARAVVNVVLTVLPRES